MIVTVLLHKQAGNEPHPGTWRAYVISNLLEYADGKYRYDWGSALWPVAEQYRQIEQVKMRVEAILPVKLPGQKIEIRWHIEDGDSPVASNRDPVV